MKNELDEGAENGYTCLDCIPYREPLTSGAPGHGFGHNLLGVAGLAACMAIKQAMDAGEVKGVIRYYGCPAEETGAGKAFMAKAGVFADVEICSILMECTEK